MSKVILKGYILVPNVDLDIIKVELVKHKQLSIEELGCLLFKVNQDENNPSRFNVYEEFVDQVSFDHHQARVKDSNWGRVTKNVERHYKIKFADNNG